VVDTRTSTPRPHLPDATTLTPITSHNARSTGHIQSTRIMHLMKTRWLYWLSILGPSTTWLLRRVAAGFDRTPDGFDLPLSDTAREIGLGDKGGRHSPFVRSIARACQFEMARVAEGGLEVRRRIPPLNRRQVTRLPDGLRAAHDAWQEAQLGLRGEDAARRSARSLALTMLEIDPDGSAVEQRLTSWRIHPAVAHDATMWALDRHARAAEACAAAQL